MRLNIINFFEKYNKYQKIKKLQKINIDIMNPYFITDIDSIKFGEYIYIGPESYIMSNGGLSIGNNVIIGPKLTIWTENHNFKSDTMVPYDEYDFLKPILIEDNVWIGMGVTICPGTRIREGAIVGMGSVVRGEIPSRAIVFGNPAQVLSYRDAEIYEKIKKENGFYYKIKKETNIKRKKIEIKND